jgi:addiction module HigA family antidote
MCRAITHPGAGIQDIITLRGTTIKDAAKSMGVCALTLSNIIHERTGISTEMALKLEQWTGRAAEVWAFAQASYDLYKVRGVTLTKQGA